MSTYKLYRRYEQLNAVITEMRRLDYDCEAVVGYTNEGIEENKQGLIKALQEHDKAINMLMVIDYHYNDHEYTDLIKGGTEIYNDLEVYNGSGEDTYHLEVCIDLGKEGEHATEDDAYL